MNNEFNINIILSQPPNRHTLFGHADKTHTGADTHRKALPLWARITHASASHMSLAWDAGWRANLNTKPARSRKRMRNF